MTPWHGRQPDRRCPLHRCQRGQRSRFAGVGRVIAAKSDVFAAYDAAAWAQAIDAVAPQGTVLALASARSKDLAARLAARRGLPVVQDVVGIDGAQLTSPILSGKAMQTVEATASVITLRANVFAAADAGGGADVSVVDATGDVRTAVVEMMARASERLDVAEANIIVSGGRGMGDPATSASKRWPTRSVPPTAPARRRGPGMILTACRSVRPARRSTNLYIAVGISGAIQHLAGALLEVHRGHQQGRRCPSSSTPITASWPRGKKPSVLTSTPSGMMSRGQAYLPAVGAVLCADANEGFVSRSCPMVVRGPSRMPRCRHQAAKGGYESSSPRAEIAPCWEGPCARRSRRTRCRRGDRGAIDPKQKADPAEVWPGVWRTSKVRLPTWTVSP